MGNAIDCPTIKLYRQIGRVIVILRPLRWVGFDVTVDPVHFAFVADDTFVIIALPYGDTGGVAHYIDLFCRNRFECTNQPT